MKEGKKNNNWNKRTMTAVLNVHEKSLHLDTSSHKTSAHFEFIHYVITCMHVLIHIIRSLSFIRGSFLLFLYYLLFTEWKKNRNELKTKSHCTFRDLNSVFVSYSFAYFLCLPWLTLLLSYTLNVINLFHLSGISFFFIIFFSFSVEFSMAL